MDAKMQVFLLALCLCVGIAFAGECCKSYTDLSGTYHSAQVCEDYCCWKLDFSLNTRTCCSNILKRVPEEYRDDCESWIKDNLWVPIVASIAFIVTIVLICTCCCCGCCACCRRGQPGVIVTQVPSGPSHTVVMTSQQQQQTVNPAHYGYNQ